MYSLEHYLSIFTKAVFIENIVLAYFLGLCSFLAISKRIDASVGIGPLRLTDVTTRALPIKVLEYMAVGLPIIAQEGTLSEDVLVNEKNGYFFNGEDDLVSKITLLLDKPEKIERMSQESTKMVQKFSWDSVIRNIIEKVNKI